MEQEPKKRSIQQNKALHKYCDEVADELAAHGVTVQAFIRNIEADITPELVKELWRAFARAKYGKTSTADLTQEEFSAVFEEVTRHIANLHVYLPFPSDENSPNALASYEKYGIIEL